MDHPKSYKRVWGYARPGSPRDAQDRVCATLFDFTARAADINVKAEAIAAGLQARDGQNAKRQASLGRDMSEHLRNVRDVEYSRRHFVRTLKAWERSPGLTTRVLAVAKDSLSWVDEALACSRAIIKVACDSGQEDAPDEASMAAQPSTVQ